MPGQANKIPQRCQLTLDDGAHLSYYTIGRGPSLIIIPGALSYALTHLDLALALSSTYTVHLLSRRGRGLSSPYPPSTSNLSRALGLHHETANSASTLPPTYDPQLSKTILDTDISDLVSLVAHTHSAFILGYSSGAAILLEACAQASSNPLRYPAFAQVKKVIIFEPPLLLSDQPALPDIDLNLMGRYESEMAKRDITNALITMMKLAKLGPGWLQASPRFVVWVLLKIVGRLEKKEVRGREKRRVSGHNKLEVGSEYVRGGRSTEYMYEFRGATTMRDLAPLVRCDFAAIMASRGPLEKYEKVNVGREVLLLGGSESPAYLREGLRLLSEAMVGVEKIEIQGVGHGVLATKIWGGDVEKGVGVIKKFLS